VLKHLIADKVSKEYGKYYEVQSISYNKIKVVGEGDVGVFNHDTRRKGTLPYSVLVDRPL